MGQMVFFHQPAQEGGHINGKDIQRGQVDRYRHGLVALIKHAAQPAAHRLPDKLIQIGDDAVLFQNGDEHRGGDPAAVRPPPAGQGFRAHHAAGGYAALGLQEKADFPALQRPLKIAEQAELIGLLLVDFGAVQLDALAPRRSARRG